MTALDEIYRLMAGVPHPAMDVVRLVDELIGAAQHSGMAVIEYVQDKGLCCREMEGGKERWLPHFHKGLFRTILARIAVLCSDESGVEFDPYHGRYALRRSGRIGAVRLDVAIENTPAMQRVEITPVPISATPAPVATNGAAMQHAATEHVG